MDNGLGLSRLGFRDMEYLAIMCTVLGLDMDERNTYERVDLIRVFKV